MKNKRPALFRGRHFQDEIIVRAPEECISARTTHTISADFKTKVEPCQFGGDPDCSRCGCIASMGLAAIGNHKLGGVLPVDIIFRTSLRIGQLVAGTRANGDRECGQTLPLAGEFTQLTVPRS